MKQKDKISLPSAHQINDEAILECVMGNNEFPAIGIPCKVLAVHFYPGKVKYDLELLFSDNRTTRIYNVDSIVVK